MTAPEKVYAAVNLTYDGKDYPPGAEILTANLPEGLVERLLDRGEATTSRPKR